MKPTHIEGHLLDHAYLRDTKEMIDITVGTQSKYYSDHKAITIIAEKKGKRNKRLGFFMFFIFLFFSS